MLEVVERVGPGGGFQGLVPGGGLGDLVEEELVGLLEVRGFQSRGAPWPSLWPCVNL
jgi:hypothetical protein